MFEENELDLASVQEQRWYVEVEPAGLAATLVGTVAGTCSLDLLEKMAWERKQVGIAGLEMGSVGHQNQWHSGYAWDAEQQVSVAAVVEPQTVSASEH